MGLTRGGILRGFGVVGNLRTPRVPASRRRAIPTLRHPQVSQTRIHPSAERGGNRRSNSSRDVKEPFCQNPCADPPRSTAGTPRRRWRGLGGGQDDAPVVGERMRGPARQIANPSSLEPPPPSDPRSGTRGRGGPPRGAPRSASGRGPPSSARASPTGATGPASRSPARTPGSSGATAAPLIPRPLPPPSPLERPATGLGGGRVGGAIRLFGSVGGVRCIGRECFSGINPVCEAGKSIGQTVSYGRQLPMVFSPRWPPSARCDHLEPILAYTLRWGGGHRQRSPGAANPWTMGPRGVAVGGTRSASHGGG